MNPFLVINRQCRRLWGESGDFPLFPSPEAAPVTSATHIPFLFKLRSALFSQYEINVPQAVPAALQVPCSKAAPQRPLRTRPAEPPPLVWLRIYRNPPGKRHQTEATRSHSGCEDATTLGEKAEKFFSK